MQVAGSAAEGMMLLGDAVSNLAYGMKLRQDEAFLTDFEVQTAKGLTQNLSDLSQGKFTDLVGADGRKIGAERLDGYFQKLRDESERVGQGNPRLGAAMKERIARAEIHGTGTLQKIESEKFRDYDRSVVLEASALDSQAYASAQNDGERGIILARGLGRFDSRRGTTLTEQEAVEHGQKWATQTHVDYVGNRLKTDPMIASGSPEQAAKMVADLTDPLKYPFLGVTAKNHIIQLFEATRRQLNQTAAYTDAATTWKDPARAATEALNPDNIKKWGITVQEAAQMYHIFRSQDVDQKNAIKERQEANLDKIMTVALKNPTQALSLIKDADDVDPKAALSLKNSIESHIKAQSLMSAQTRASNRDYEDKVKLEIKINIDAGKYKNETELKNAVLASGVTNSTAFYDDVKGNFQAYKKDAGAINFFKMAENDWKAMATGVKSRKVQQNMRGELPKILNTLQIEMGKQGLRVSDPKVFEIYKGLRKARTQTWFQSAVETVKNVGGDMMGGIGDSFVVPTAPAPVVPPVVPPVVTQPEKTVRAQLEKKGIRGTDQDRWVEKYRSAGVVK